MKHFTLLSIILFTLSAAASAKQKLVMASDIWCPYVCAGEQEPGYVVELVREILGKQGIATELILVPFARAQILAKSGQVDLVLAITQEHINSSGLVKTNQAFGSFANDFFVTVDSKWQYASMERLLEDISLHRQRLGVIKDYIYPEPLQQLIMEGSNLIQVSAGTQPLNLNIQLLLKNRLDVILDSRNTVFYLLKKHQISTIKYAGTEGGTISLFIGVSSALDNRIVSMLDNGIVEMRETDKLIKILSKYGINDWNDEKVEVF